jgi:hypothetical protein
VFQQAEALRIVTPQSLTPTILELIRNYDERVALGQRAAKTLRAQQGATERTVSALLELLHEQTITPAAPVPSEQHV